jgi:hypothetical protein
MSLSELSLLQSTVPGRAALLYLLFSYFGYKNDVQKYKRKIWKFGNLKIQEGCWF